ncbi:MAG: hypothetical protein MIO92_04170 [Methanosarcinaceae archaeon]|nr:hypothetical protein [Methanosarcinaceae archaeon]
MNIRQIIETGKLWFIEDLASPARSRERKNNHEKHHNNFRPFGGGECHIPTVCSRGTVRDRSIHTRERREK